MTEPQITFFVWKSPEGGYGAQAFGHSIFTQAESLEELKTILRDAVFCHFGDKCASEFTSGTELCETQLRDFVANPFGSFLMPRR